MDYPGENSNPLVSQPLQSKNESSSEFSNSTQEFDFLFNWDSSCQTQSTISAAPSLEFQNTDTTEPVIEHSDFTSEPPAKRAKFAEPRRKEVGFVRKIGACFRCRILKVSCSGNRPCDSCIKAQTSCASHVKYRWMQCVPFSLKDFDIFSTDTAYDRKVFAKTFDPFFRHFKCAHFAFSKIEKKELAALASQFEKRTSSQQCTRITYLSGYQAIPALAFEQFVSPLMGQHFGLNLFLLSISGSACDLSDGYTTHIGLTHQIWHNIRSYAGSEVLRGLERALSKKILARTCLEDLRTLTLLVYWTMFILWYWTPLKHTNDRQHIAQQQQLLRVLSHHLVILAERAFEFSVAQFPTLPTKTEEADLEISRDLHIDWLVYAMRNVMNLPCISPTLSINDTSKQEDSINKQITLDAILWQAESPMHLSCTGPGKDARVKYGCWYDREVIEGQVIVDHIQSLGRSSSLWNILQAGAGEYDMSQCAFENGLEESFDNERLLIRPLRSSSDSEPLTSLSKTPDMHLGNIAATVQTFNDGFHNPALPFEAFNRAPQHYSTPTLGYNPALKSELTLGGAYGRSFTASNESWDLNIAKIYGRNNPNNCLQIPGPQPSHCGLCGNSLSLNNQCRVCILESFRLEHTRSPLSQDLTRPTAMVPEDWSLVQTSGNNTMVGSFGFEKKAPGEQR